MTTVTSAPLYRSFFLKKVLFQKYFYIHIFSHLTLYNYKILNMSI